MRRISVVGNSGSGKSLLAERAATALGVPFVELDAIHHRAGWEPIDPDEFLVRVAEVAATDAWVIDGNYRSVVVDGPVWQRADTVVWLDLPRRRVMRQVTARTVRRVVRREKLWNGNREPVRNLWARESVIRWAWTQHSKYADRYGAAMASPRYDHVDFVRLTSHEDAARWITALSP